MGREMRHRQRRDARTGRMTEGNEDKRADALESHEPWQQDHADQAAAYLGCLQKQEGTDDW